MYREAHFVLAVLVHRQSRWIMMKSLTLVLLAFSIGASAAEPPTFVLRDQINTTWKDEAVSFRLNAPAGTCHPESVRLRGPEGAVACQLSDVQLWPGTPFLKTGTLWFMTSLKPLERREYRVEWAGKPAPGAGPSEDLKLVRNASMAQFETSRFGVRLRLGGKAYAEPVAPDEVPGPVSAFRLADGTWFGGSDLYGKTKLRSWSAELTALGPVFAEGRYRYTYEDGNTLDLTVRIAARDDRVQFDVKVARDSRRDGLRIVLNRGLKPLTLHVQKRYNSRSNLFPKSLGMGEWASLPVSDLKPGTLISVTPWGPWWNDLCAPVVRLGIGNNTRELHVARRDPASWVKPVGRANHKNLKIVKSAAGEIYIDVNLSAREAGGVRKFDLAESKATETVGWRHRRDKRGRRVGSQIIPYREPLNVVKDYILEWPRKTAHPTIFMSAVEVTASRPVQIDKVALARLEAFARSQPLIRAVPGEPDVAALTLWLVSGDDEVARKYKLAERLIHHLGLLGDFDKMRSTTRVAVLFDALIDTDLITPEQRRVLRAQMAYLAYQVVHPATWSSARGWNSGNMNMTVSYHMEAPGVMAAVLSDHPLAKEWMKSARTVMDSMLNRIGPDGEWPESTGYSNLSISELLTFAIMTRRAGLANYVDDPRLRRAVEFLIKVRQPPDPRVGGIRDHIRFGRSPGQTRPLDGAIARATRSTDPEYSRRMQWNWMQTLKTGGRSTELDMGGFEHLYLDPSLPARAPDWTTESFRHMGVVFRKGFGTKDEHFAALLSGDRMIYCSQTGGLVSLCAYGRPVAGSFLGGYGYQAEFLVNRVSLASDPGAFVRGKSAFYYRGAPRNNSFDEDLPRARFEKEEGIGNVSAFSALPRQDYAAVDVLMKHPIRFKKSKMAPPGDLPWPKLVSGNGKPPLWWRRQALMLKDDDPAGANYLLLRDTTSGGQPTMWTFWTASEKLGTPKEAADRKAFLADAPGNAIVKPRALSGNRFTALGSWGVDLEYYVAAPTDTPRHTMRWGTRFKVSRRWGVSQYQDLLHLQQGGDGVYYVALFPRRAGTPAPRFSSLDKGKIIKVSGTFGTDWGFLSARSAEASAEGLRFMGTAASVQDRGGKQVLSLGAAGSVDYREYGLKAGFPVSLRIHPKVLKLELPAKHPGGQVALRAPATVVLQQPPGPAGLTLASTGRGAWMLTLPAGVSKVELKRK